MVAAWYSSQVERKKLLLCQMLRYVGDVVVVVANDLGEFVWGDVAQAQAIDDIE